RDLFYVENDLDFIGDIIASGEFQGDLEEDDWVRAGEEVTISGPVVVYEDTEDIYPPDGAFDVVVQDNAGRFSKVSHVSGAAVSISLGVEDATDPDENLTLTLQNLPGLATVVSQPRFSLGVDGDLPTFTNIVPGPDDWHSSKDVLVSATADDMATAGVSAVTLEYSYSTNGGLTFTDWSRTGLETTSDGPMVDGLVLLDIPDGENNFIRWRAIDLVGNGPAVSANLRIRVDTINVTYTGAFPDPNDWHTVLEVECGVTIRDEDGAGIEVASIQYRVSHSNLSGYGGWQTWGASSGDVQEISVAQLIALGDSAYNYLQWRAKDIAGNGYTTSPHFRVRVDTSPIEFYALFPEVGPHGQAVLLCGANVTDGHQGSGILLSSIDYRVLTGGQWSEWMNVGMTGTSQENQFSVEATFEDGENNRIQFRGSDVAGNGPTISEEHYLTVDTTGPEFDVMTPGPEEKQPTSEVTVAITLSDGIAGVDATAFKYRFGTDGSLGEWTTAPLSPIGEGRYKTEIAIDFATGVDNVVQFKALDVLGNEAMSEVASIWVNRAPSAHIKSPTTNEVYRENDPVTLNGTLSSDPDEDKLNYTWYIDLQAEPIGYGMMLDVDLPVGIYNVTLSVTDDVGAKDIISVQVTVEEYIPPSTETSSVIWWVLLVVVLATIMGATFIIWKRRNATDEWEEI
ncbi:MAG: hypothetical protein KAJ35_08570, partial [Thermoplasmata archaeon]|nr:hypothetical protein [Thermoplasmata archaeon]